MYTIKLSLIISLVEYKQKILIEIDVKTDYFALIKIAV